MRTRREQWEGTAGTGPGNEDQQRTVSTVKGQGQQWGHSRDCEGTARTMRGRGQQQGDGGGTGSPVLSVTTSRSMPSGWSSNFSSSDSVGFTPSVICRERSRCPGGPAGPRLRPGWQPPPPGGDFGGEPGGSGGAGAHHGRHGEALEEKTLPAVAVALEDEKVAVRCHVTSQ